MRRQEWSEQMLRTYYPWDVFHKNTTCQILMLLCTNDVERIKYFIVWKLQVSTLLQCQPQAQRTIEDYCLRTHLIYFWLSCRQLKILSPRYQYSRNFWLYLGALLQSKRKAPSKIIRRLDISIQVPIIAFSTEIVKGMWLCWKTSQTLHTTRSTVP